MRFGVEHEFFVFRVDGRVPTVEDIQRLYDQLASVGYEPGAHHAVTGQPLSMTKATPTGKRRIGCDCCSNTLELTLPPLGSEAGFRTEYAEAESEVLQAMDRVGLQRHVGATLDAVPENVVLWPSHTDPTGDRLTAVANRPPTTSSLFCREIFAVVASTQVHLELPREEGFRLLPRLYDLEWLVPQHFSQSQKYLGHRVHSARALAIWENFDPTERLLGIPEKIPTSQLEYEQLNIGKQRDYSFIVPREHTFEFRSADSQPDVDAIWRLIEFRLWQVTTASVAGDEYAMIDPAERFREASRRSRVVHDAIPDSASKKRESQEVSNKRIDRSDAKQRSASTHSESSF